MNTANLKSDPRLKFRIQKVIALFSFILFTGKLTAYFLTNSVGILTDALESTVNVFTGIISLYSIFISIGEKLKKIILDNFSDDIVFTVHTDDCRILFCNHCKNTECRDRKSEFESKLVFSLENIMKERKERVDDQNMLN